eukprot:scaffold387_cov244-Pinguiococcus_pyrenoidosus.AAC.10
MDSTGVLVCVEVHKRFDPIYQDAYDRIQDLGDFSYLYAYMSQPKHQLETFKAWAGKSSDISYYLNSHHVDFNEWVVGKRAIPVCVTATGSTGVASSALDVDTEDSITLTVQWKNLESGNLGTAVYTAAWIAPRADVHSQQRFFYMGTRGEITVDQAHRGYTQAKDEQPFASVNPLFMKYTPTRGKFSGQSGYGYRSFEVFIDACADVQARRADARSFDESLPTIHSTYLTTAILEAGRRSLDRNGCPINILYAEGAESESHLPIGMAPKQREASNENPEDRRILWAPSAATEVSADGHSVFLSYGTITAPSPASGLHAPTAVSTNLVRIRHRWDHVHTPDSRSRQQVRRPTAARIPKGTPRVWRGVCRRRRVRERERATPVQPYCDRDGEVAVAKRRVRLGFRLATAPRIRSSY